MKYCIVVPDGAADLAIHKLENRTPLQVARTPNMGRAARDGMLGLTCHVPARLAPGSEVAMMSLVGYDPTHHYTGRGPLEAAGLGIELGPTDWAVRCNLITASDGTLADFTAGHISTEEAAELLKALNDGLGGPGVRFYVGTSYRHVMVLSSLDPVAVQTTAPHDVVGEPMRGYYPKGPGAEMLIPLMERSRDILRDHEVNKVRLDLGKNPASMIWLWSPGKRPEMPPFHERYGLRGAAISAVNLVRGIARLIGWDVIHVPGATGYTDTDYAAKGRYALDALGRYDLVLVHVEAPDEASHECDLAAKIRSIEMIDREIVGPIMAEAEREGGLRLLVCPDHVTSVEDGKHKRDNVPFLMWGERVGMRSGLQYCETDARATDVVVEHGHELMAELVGVHPRV